MSSVLVLITIPERRYEPEIRQRETKQRQQNNNHFNKATGVTNNLSTNNNNNNATIAPPNNPENQITLDVPKKVSNIEKESSEIKKIIPSPLTPRFIEEIVEDGLDYLGIVDATWTPTKNGRYLQIVFAVDLEDSDVVIQYFKSLGIGLRFDTSIGIVPFTLFYYNEEALNDQAALSDDDGEKGEQPVQRTLSQFKQQQNKFLKSITARLTVAQVVSNVKSNAEITFDFICYIVFASCIAAMGLLDNSVISLVASMLVSPMMGPLMALTFGACIRDRSLIRMGLRNVAFTFAFCVLIGFTFGIIALNFTNQWNPDGPWPTDMMRERGLLRVAWVGTLVAFPSGCAVAISMLSANEAGLVGVAISVSLLPPCVNGGLLFANSLLSQLRAINEVAEPFTSRLNNLTIDMKPSLFAPENYHVVYNENISIESALLGLVSLMFSLVNIVNIFLGAMLLLKVKEIVPFASMSAEKRRFFQEDIRIVREYNEKTVDPNYPHTSTGVDGEEVLREWATIAGLDSKDFLSPDSRKVQIQTLADIAKDVEADIVYQTVSKNLSSTGGNATRRLSHGLWKNSHTSAVGRRASHASPPLVTVTNVDRKPSFVGASRRRISVAPFSACALGQSNPAFTFSDTDIAAATQHDRNRRFSTAILRRTLQNTEHSPYSLWPSTRSPHSDSKFTVVPVIESADENPKSLSMSQLNRI